MEISVVLAPFKEILECRFSMMLGSHSCLLFYPHYLVPFQPLEKLCNSSLSNELIRLTKKEK